MADNINTNSSSKLRIGIVIVLLGIVGYASYYYINKSKVNHNNTESSLLIPDGINTLDMNNTDIIKNNTLGVLDDKTASSYSKSQQLTTFFNIYLSTFKTNNGVKKNIMLKDGSFQWSFQSRTNNIDLDLYTGNNQTQTITIQDIPLRKWISIACVVDGNQVTIYRDSMFYKSVALHAPISFKNAPILLGRGDGINSYAGQIATLYYSYTAEPLSNIVSLYNNNKPPKIVPTPGDNVTQCPTTQ